jgi:hypothetical protein
VLPLAATVGGSFRARGGDRGTGARGAEQQRPLLSFGLGPGVVRDIARDLVAWLAFAETAPDAWQQIRAALAETAQAEFGWPQVAAGVVAAAQGHLSELPPVPGRVAVQA